MELWTPLIDCGTQVADFHRGTLKMNQEVQKINKRRRQEALFYDSDEERSMIKCIQKNKVIKNLGSRAFWTEVKNQRRFSTARSPSGLAARWMKYTCKRLDSLIPDEVERQKFENILTESRVGIVPKADRNPKSNLGLSFENLPADGDVYLKKNDGKQGGNNAVISTSNFWTTNRSAKCEKKLIKDRRKQSNAKKEINIRKGRFLHRCKFCKYKSNRLFNVIRHSERFHKNLVSRSCCGLELKNKYDWYVHCKSAHPEKRRAPNTWKRRYQKIAEQSSTEPKSFLGKSKRLLHATLLREMDVNSLNQVKMEDVPLIYFMKDSKLKDLLQPSIIDSRNIKSSDKETSDSDNFKALPDSYPTAGADEDSIYTEFQQFLKSELLSSESPDDFLHIAPGESLMVEDCDILEQLNEIIESIPNDDTNMNLFDNEDLTFFDLSNTSIHI